MAGQSKDAPKDRVPLREHTQPSPGPAGFDQDSFKIFFDKVLAPAGFDPRNPDLRGLRAATYNKIAPGGLSGLLIPYVRLLIPAT